LTSLAMVLFVLAGAAVFADGNLSPGQREGAPTAGSLSPSR
jgi:hypothetical protein